MLVRDSGVVQLFAENAQEAYDLTVIAPRIAEHPDVLLPVLVCQDGFTITTRPNRSSCSPTRSSAPSSATTGSRTRCSTSRIPRRTDRSRCPTTTSSSGAQQAAALRARRSTCSPRSPIEFDAADRPHATRARGYRLDGATRAIVALGSTAGTIKDVVDELATRARRVGLLKIALVPSVPGGGCRGSAATASSRDRARPRRLARRAPPLHAEVAAALYGSDVELARPRLRARRPRPPSRRTSATIFAGAAPGATSACEVTTCPA